MIGHLRGTITHKQPPLLIIDVNGVGYEVFASMNTFYHLPEQDDHVNLLTHMVVREDAQILYGFYQEQERQLFRALIKVSGVGPKLALTVLSGMESDQFVRCVQQNDASLLVNIPGIGKKTAQRLILETRDNLSHWHLSTTLDHNQTPATPIAKPVQDAISALTSLGYKPNEARLAVSQISEQSDSTLNVEELIRLALQQLAKGSK